MHPEPELRDATRALELAEQAVELAPTEAFCRNTSEPFNTARATITPRLRAFSSHSNSAMNSTTLTTTFSSRWHMATQSSRRRE